MNDKYLYIAFSAILLTTGISLSMIQSSTVMLSKDDWKCVHAQILNQDPSQTECTVYRKDLHMISENQH